MSAFEVGIYSFAEMTPDPETGRTVGPRERLQRAIELLGTVIAPSVRAEIERRAKAA